MVIAWTISCFSCQKASINIESRTMKQKTNFPNWFEITAKPYFERNLQNLRAKKLLILQLGSFTGDATAWLFENIMGHPESLLVDVDTWEGSDQSAHENFDWDAIEEFYLTRHAEKLEAKRLEIFKGATDFFFESRFGARTFDFIYIDASHKSSDVLRDGINSFHRIKVGGLVAFDDYLWSDGRGSWNTPRPAIDALAACYADRFVVKDAGPQVWFQRIA